MNARNLSLDIIDPSTFQDFRDAMSSAIQRIDNLVYLLRHGDEVSGVISQLFRELHNLKGDANICQVYFAEPFLHGLESMLDRLRQKALPYDEVLGDVVLLVMDRLELTLDVVAHGELIGDMQLPFLLNAIHLLDSLPPEALVGHCHALIVEITGAQATVMTYTKAPTPTPNTQSTDLVFFRSLALQFEQLMPQFTGRTQRNLDLALETNQQAGNLVNPDQLEAAVYMHDIGMMLLPESLWLKVGRLSAKDRKAIAAHPLWAAGLLERMPGWQEAAQMVRQHHETPDGKGYPDGLKGTAICPGARILALIDTFESVVLKHAHQGIRRSVLRAAAEINASERQFDQQWLVPFNQVIRARMRDG